MTQATQQEQEDNWILWEMLMNTPAGLQVLIHKKIMSPAETFLLRLIV